MLKNHDGRYLRSVGCASGYRIDWLTPKKSLGALAGVFFGLLVGMFISWAVSFVIVMINDIYNIGLGAAAIADK